jgi:hypothetical protein
LCLVSCYWQLSFMFASYDPGFRSIVGAVIAIAAMVAYTHVNMKEVSASKGEHQKRGAGVGLTDGNLCKVDPAISTKY